MSLKFLRVNLEGGRQNVVLSLTREACHRFEAFFHIKVVVRLGLYTLF
jgi:hypothetical protein